MPDFRILDQNDFLRTMAVFLMMFLFIAIICLMSALIICYTRCVTIALNNRYVFEDLQRLGASPAYLRRELRSQASRVFAVPAIVGMSAMYLLYCMIMFANDGKTGGNRTAGARHVLWCSDLDCPAYLYSLPLHAASDAAETWNLR